jgi:putative membrane protein
MTHNGKIKALAAGFVSLGLAFGAAAQQYGSTGSATAPKAGAATDKAGGKAAAKPADSAKDSRKAGLSSADRTFIMKAGQGGLAEVELGKMAQERAANDQVKQFASRMVEDHGKANEELRSLASAKGVSLAAALDKPHKATSDKLQRLKGPDFDREYMKHMVDDHRKTVADFQKAAKGAKDSDVKGFASKSLPTLREHMKLAQATQSALKGSGKAGVAASSSGSAAGGGGSMTGAAGSGGAPGTGKSPATGGSGTSKDRTTGTDEKKK